MTKRFILLSLNEYMEKNNEDTDCTELINILYNSRKKMELCLGHYFNDDQKGIEIVNYIYDQRKCDEIAVLKRKVHRDPVTIDNGPISDDAVNTIRSPDNTEDNMSSDEEQEL